MRSVQRLGQLFCLFLSAWVPTPAAGADPSPVQQQQAAALSRHAADLIDARKLPEAESALRQSLAIVPAHPTRLYNLACVLAGEKKFPDALGALEQAADAGFTDFTNLTQPLHDTAFVVGSFLRRGKWHGPYKNRNKAIAELASIPGITVRVTCDCVQ